MFRALTKESRYAPCARCKFFMPYHYSADNPPPQDGFGRSGECVRNRDRPLTVAEFSPGCVHNSIYSEPTRRALDL